MQIYPAKFQNDRTFVRIVYQHLRFIGLEAGRNCKSLHQQIIESWPDFQIVSFRGHLKGRAERLHLSKNNIEDTNLVSNITLWYIN